MQQSLAQSNCDKR